MYSHRSSTGPVDLAFTDRHGGVGGVPGGTEGHRARDLDLALPPGVRAGVAPTTGEEPWRGLRTVLADLAPDAEACVGMEQVHGAEVVVVDDTVLAGPELDGPVADAGPDRGARAGGPRLLLAPTACDALVTDRPDVVLVVRVADCVPVLLADPARGVVGAAHAGRAGVERGVVEACVRRMRDLGALEVRAWVGPHVCGGCYEVPAALQDEVAATEPTARATTRWGTPALDLGAAVADQLTRAGVTVHEVAPCTLESPDLHSYRRDGAAAGRAAGLIRRRS